MACAGDLTASIRGRSWASTKASTCLATAAWCWSPLPGHTPGSVGLFVTLDSGRRLFFSGDTSWRLEGVEGPRQKFFAGRALVDRDPARTLAQLAKIRLLLRSDPRLSVIPAHDARVQAALGYFPHWLE